MIRDAMTLYGDNDTATARARERKATVNDRHTALKYHTIREWVNDNQIITDRVGTLDNPSDLETKASSGTVMERLYLPLKGYAPTYISEQLQESLRDPSYYTQPAL